jgi:hypothetical protein
MMHISVASYAIAVDLRRLIVIGCHRDTNERYEHPRSACNIIVGYTIVASEMFYAESWAFAVYVPLDTSGALPLFRIVLPPQRRGTRERIARLLPADCLLYVKSYNQHH